MEPLTIALAGGAVLGVYEYLKQARLAASNGKVVVSPSTPTNPPLPPPNPVYPAPTVQTAAAQMISNLSAHGYKLSDQPSYRQFQTLNGGLTVDGFPGPKTMAALNAQMLSMTGVPDYVSPGGTISLPIYPWAATTPTGATGQAAYDGVNAPTWDSWTGVTTASLNAATAQDAAAAALAAALGQS